MDHRSAQSLSDLLDHLNSSTHQDELRQIFDEALARSGVKYCLTLAIDWSVDGRPLGEVIVQRSPVGLIYELLEAAHPHLIAMIVSLGAKGTPEVFGAASARALPKDWRNFLRQHPLHPEVNWCLLVPVFRVGQMRGAAFYCSEQPITPEATRWLIALTERGYDKLAAIGILPRASPFSGRQRDALRFVASGKSDWEIAQLLGISVATAHEHVENAKRKLGVRTRVQAVVLATRNRWI